MVVSRATRRDGESFADWKRRVDREEHRRITERTAYCNIRPNDIQANIDGVAWAPSGPSGSKGEIGPGFRQCLSCGRPSAAGSKGDCKRHEPPGVTGQNLCVHCGCDSRDAGCVSGASHLSLQAYNNSLCCNCELPLAFANALCTRHEGTQARAEHLCKVRNCGLDCRDHPICEDCDGHGSTANARQKITPAQCAAALRDAPPNAVVASIPGHAGRYVIAKRFRCTKCGYSPVPGTVLARSANGVHNSMLPHIRTQHCSANAESYKPYSIKTGGGGRGVGAVSKGIWERCPASCVCPASGVSYCTCAVSSAGAITSFFSYQQVS